MKARPNRVPLPELSTQGWRDRAECRTASYLPWTANARPEPHEIEMMRTVCEDCPVLVKCTEQVLSEPEQGGFWAGVWLPWKTSRSDEEARGFPRKRARAILRNRLAATQPLSESPVS